ncbi:MAG: hypothetical protein K6T61_15255, partial [Bryobacteraceae bacterium]|nr:hypothetical protein [Bryobacteraceae bacterium]
MFKGFLKEASYFFKTLVKALLFFYLPIVVALTVLHFPYDTDPPLQFPDRAPSGKSGDTPERAKRRPSEFYSSAYDIADHSLQGMDYERTAKRAADTFKIEKLVREFVSRYGLEQKKVLEVGSGRGYLQ